MGRTFVAATRAVARGLKRSAISLSTAPSTAAHAAMPPPGAAAAAAATARAPSARAALLERKPAPPSTASRTRAYETVDGLRVDAALKNLVDATIMPGTGVEPGAFWSGFAAMVRELAPRNAALLRTRDKLQAQIDVWHRTHPAVPPDAEAYASFLAEIGYVEPPASAEPVAVLTENVDAELASVAGPQLVCPVDNARFILNACNARWGSLLDALYGTDALPGARGGAYDPQRGAAVFEEVHRRLDHVLPLVGGSWGGVTGLSVTGSGHVRARLDGGAAALAHPADFVGYTGPATDPKALLFKRHGLHVELVVDRRHPVGAAHAAGLRDVRLESALTTIADAEDSACTVDAEDKMRVYANWAGLMKGDLAVEMAGGADGKAGGTRALAPDRTWTRADGRGEVTVPGRAVLLCRNVGLHMYTDIAQLESGPHSGPGSGGSPVDIPEHFLDAAITVLAAKHDLLRTGRFVNSRAGSVYVVKPKMHSSAEVALVDELFGRVEALLGLGQHTVKLGVMDEERRASVNLPEMIRAAKHRLVFINTGFLDRTGDEIHTSMEAGPMPPKAELKATAWYPAYEEANVATGLAAGLVGRGQIGKGMWAAPDAMAKMLKEKVGHLHAGASCAWVPNPTAATLHALHYLETSVPAVQAKLAALRGRDSLSARPKLLTIPVEDAAHFGHSRAHVHAELDNNAQGILGYVSRWVGQGVGCSKVKDLHGVALMEDRATLRISSQHIANWLRHAVVSEDEVLESLTRMARLVDEQNAADPDYKPMAPDFDGPEWHAALDLVFGGRDAPNGYTEFTLTARRQQRKAMGG